MLLGFVAYVTRVAWASTWLTGPPNAVYAREGVCSDAARVFQRLAA